MVSLIRSSIRQRRNKLSLTELKFHDASRISVFNLLVPVFGTVLSGLMLGENVFRIETLISLILISLGIAFVNMNLKKSGGKI